jgi:N-acetylneuraminate synthase/N,N'-diacetyllegionaminate synthase
MNSMHSSLSLGGRRIGPAHPTLIIAEIGVNHDGSLDRALGLVHAAKAAGADAIKLQVFRADSLMHASSRFAAYQEQCDEASPAAMLQRYELSADALRQIVAVARQLGLLPIATPFSLSDIPLIESLDLAAIKIASPDLVNRPLIAAAARMGPSADRPLVLSTGAATLDEIDTAAGWLQHLRTPFALLHCISSYPTPADQANLCWIGELANRFAVPIGYSDHATDLLAGACAVAAGACLVEKHLTHDRFASGPDHAASADPAQFADYVKLIRAAEVLRGQAGKRVLEIEQDVRTVSRQSLVIRRDIAVGEAIHEQDLTTQRPGTGIPAADLSCVIGRRVARPLWAGTLLQWDMLDEAKQSAA